MSLQYELRLEKARLVLAQQQLVTGTPPGAAVSHDDLVAKMGEIINTVNTMSQKLKALETKNGGSPTPPPAVQPPAPINGYVAPTAYPNAPALTNATGQTIQAAPDGQFIAHTP